jgi:hypothetical protein
MSDFPEFFWKGVLLVLGLLAGLNAFAIFSILPALP